MSTPSGASSSYLSAAEFLKRYDGRLVGDLCGDVGQRVDPPSLLTDGNLQAALDDASGDVEAACLRGDRYTAADLAALTGVSQKRLYRVIARRAMGYLYERRPDKGVPPAFCAEAQADLDALAAGERIFSLQEQADAGVASHEVETASDVEDRALTATEMSRYFGTRVNRLGG